MLKAILPPVLFLLLVAFIPIEELGAVFPPLIFALIVSVVNINKFRINKIVGIILSVVLSYLIYYSSIYITLGIGQILSIIKKALHIPYSDLISSLAILAGGMVTAVLLYLAYTFIIKIQNRWKGLWAVMLIGSLLPITIWLFSKDNDYLGTDFDLYFSSWLIYAALGFGVAFNLEEIGKQLKVLGRHHTSNSSPAE